MRQRIRRSKCFHPRSQSETWAPGDGESAAVGALSEFSIPGLKSETGGTLPVFVSGQWSLIGGSGGGFGERSDSDFLVLVLKLVELPVEPALREQLLMRAHLAELALVHHQYAFSPLHGGEPVRDENAGAAFHHALQCTPYAQLSVRRSEESR